MRGQIISAVFGIYFITVVSGALLVASGTTDPWYDQTTSSAAYFAFLVTYLIILVAISIFGGLQPHPRGTHPSLSILAGPAIVSAMCLGLASIFLPAGGFLEVNYKLNTAAILVLSYSWIGVALYFAAAVGHVLRQRRLRPSKPAVAENPGQSDSMDDFDL